MWQLPGALASCKRHYSCLVGGHFLRRCPFFACDAPRPNHIQCICYLPCKRPLLGVRIGEAAQPGPLSHDMSRLTLAEARSSLRLAPGVTVREVPGDGSCLFHSVLSPAQALRRRSSGAGLWSLTSMRNHLELPASQEPTDDQITSLWHSLGLRLVIFSVELQNSSAVIDGGFIRYAGREHDTPVHLVHYTIAGDGYHFEPLHIDDRFSRATLPELRHLMQDAGLPVRKHDKHLHLAARLRSHHGWRPLDVLPPPLPPPLPSGPHFSSDRQAVPSASSSSSTTLFDRHFSGASASAPAIALASASAPASACSTASTPSIAAAATAESPTATTSRPQGHSRDFVGSPSTTSHSYDASECDNNPANSYDASECDERFTGRISDTTSGSILDTTSGSIQDSSRPHRRPAPHRHLELCHLEPDATTTRTSSITCLHHGGRHSTWRPSSRSS